MQTSNIITLILLLILLSGLTILSYFHIKKVKVKIGKVINGKIENRQINKLIKKARESGRTKFIIDMWFRYSLRFCILITIITGVMDYGIANNEPVLMKYLINFSVAFAFSSLTEVIKAHSIWHLIRKQEAHN